MRGNFFRKIFKKVVSFPQALSVEYTLLEDKVKQITIYTWSLNTSDAAHRLTRGISARMPLTQTKNKEKAEATATRNTHNK
ncbi:hypothetical protein HpBGD72_14860 [Helicobacter pylori]